VDATWLADLVLVSNGVYAAGGAVAPGGALSNRVVITNRIFVCSVGGPFATLIVGEGPAGDTAVRGVYLSGGAVLAGFTLSNGFTRTAGDVLRERSGGGVWADGAVLSNCIIQGCAAAASGGGVAGRQAQLGNCLVVGNRAGVDGGGLCVSGPVSLLHCTVADNAATNGFGGIRGVTNSALTNCIVYFNAAPAHPNLGGAGGMSIAFTCAPTNMSGAGNLTNAPIFANAAAGDYSLRYGSSGLDAGTNGISTPKDLVGISRPRDADFDGIVRVDMGCYEYDALAHDLDNDGMPDAWEYRFGLNPTNAADAAWHGDADSADNLSEYIADTNPTNAASYFSITNLSIASPVTVSFASSSNRQYTLKGCSNLVFGAWTNVPGAGPRAGTGGADSMQDTNAPPTGPFYRLGAQLP
jgi:hypothetical protein